MYSWLGEGKFEDNFVMFWKFNPSYSSCRSYMFDYCENFNLDSEIKQERHVFLYSEVFRDRTLTLKIRIQRFINVDTCLKNIYIVRRPLF